MLHLLASKFPASQAVVITLSGITIVFAVLILLVMIFKLFGVIFDKKPKKTKKEEVKPQPKTVVSTPSAPVNFDGIDEETVAVISAAVYALDNNNYSIRSIRPAKTGRQRPAWANAGIMQNVKPF